MSQEITVSVTVQYSKTYAVEDLATLVRRGAGRRVKSGPDALVKRLKAALDRGGDNESIANNLITDVVWWTNAISYKAEVKLA